MIQNRLYIYILIHYINVSCSKLVQVFDQQLGHIIIIRSSVILSGLP